MSDDHTFEDPMGESPSDAAARLQRLLTATRDELRQATQQLTEEQNRIRVLERLNIDLQTQLNEVAGEYQALLDQTEDLKMKTAEAGRIEAQWRERATAAESAWNRVTSALRRHGYSAGNDVDSVLAAIHRLVDRAERSELEVGSLDDGCIRIPVDILQEGESFTITKGRL